MWPHPETLGREGVWLLDLDLSGGRGSSYQAELEGRVERFATRAISVPSMRGPIAYKVGLAPLSLDLSADLEGTGIQVDGGPRWPLLRREGIYLDRARAVLRYHFSGQTLERTVVVLDGYTEEVQYADPEAPQRLVLTISTARVQRKLWPPDRYVVDEATWGNPAFSVNENIRGNPYQTVFGYPGSGDEDLDPPAPSVPGLMVRWNSLAGTGNSAVLVGYSHLTAGTVELWRLDEDDGTEFVHEPGPTVHTQDDLGQDVTLAEFQLGAPSLESELDAKIYIGFRNDSGAADVYGGGLPMPDGSGTLRAVGDVITWCLQRGSDPFDSGRQATENALLNRWAIDTGLSERVDWPAWVASQLATLFPIRRMLTGRGAFYRFFNRLAPPRFARAVLDVDAGDVTPVGPVLSFSEGLANRFLIDYAPAQGSNTRFTRRLILAPLPSDGVDLLTTETDARVIGSERCRVSDDHFQELVADPIQAEHLWSNLTARDVLIHRAARDALPREVVSYEGRDLGWLEAGDHVLLSHAERGYSELLCLVLGKRVGDSQWTLDLELLPPLTRTIT